MKRLAMLALVLLALPVLGRAQDDNGLYFYDGKVQEMDCEGMLAVCIQHEMDHLTGKVFVDYLSSLKQDRIRTKLKKRKAKEEAA